jgi:probable rRNA maturation factor
VTANSESEKGYTVEVQVGEQFNAQADPDLLYWAALATLIHQRLEGPCELAVVVSDDTELHELNLHYRGVDAPTDVLAFPYEDEGETYETFVGAPGMPRYLGDVIISFRRAEVQAADVGHTVQAELQLLVVHGVLHLLGYDDVTDEQRARMWTAQAEILQGLGVKVHLPEGISP